MSGDAIKALLEKKVLMSLRIFASPVTMASERIFRGNRRKPLVIGLMSSDDFICAAEAYLSHTGGDRQ